MADQGKEEGGRANQRFRPATCSTVPIDRYLNGDGRPIPVVDGWMVMMMMPSQGELGGMDGNGITWPAYHLQVGKAGE